MLSKLRPQRERQQDFFFGAQQLFGLASQPPHFERQPQENKPRKPANRSQPLRERQQDFFAQHVLGFGAQHRFGRQATLAQQDFGWPHGFAQHRARVRLWQPLPFRPSMVSSSSKPKLWVHRPVLSTSAPIKILSFIEQRLLCARTALDACLPTLQPSSELPRGDSPSVELSPGVVLNWV